MNLGNRLAGAILLVLIDALGCSAAQVGEDTKVPEHSVAQADGAVQLHFFWSHKCPHCLLAKPFVESLGHRHAWLEVRSYELLSSRGNAQTYVDMARELGREARSVPAFIFCDQMLTGFDTEDGMGAYLEAALARCHVALTGQLSREIAAAEDDATPPVTVPLFGRIDPTSLSLPVFTLVIAGVDAFNPCAFFVLLFLLSLLVHARSRLRMMVIGGIFVLCSGLVYFLFMAAWLNVFLLLGELRIITLLAGILAVAVAALNIKDYFYFQKGVSLSIPDSAKPSLFQRMRTVVNAESWPTMLFGAIVLAVVANSYELLCTAGFPMVYTRVLTLSGLSQPGYYLYLGFYNLIYVIPLAVIVLVFALTLGSRKLSERDGRMLKLVSGLMMLGLGLLLVFAPALLNRVGVAVVLLVLAIGIAAIIVIAGQMRGGQVQ
ncbi:MAG: NrdH-redoxin [Pseudomonadales bacterium]